MYHKDCIEVRGNRWKTARLLPVHLVFFRQSLWATRLRFPGSSVGKEPACNAGDPSLIPESGRSPLQNINTFLDTAAINHRNAVCFHLERSAINSHCPICYVKSFSSVQFISVQFSRSVVSDSLRPHESQHARPPCPSPTPGFHSDSRPSSP